MDTDASHSTSSPKHRIPSNPVSQSHKSLVTRGSPLLLLKLCTQVNQHHLSIWLISCELSHIGDLLWIPSLGHKLLMLHFLLYNKPHCQVMNRSLIMFIITISSSLTASLSEMLGSSGPQGPCSNASVRCSSSIQASLHIAHQHGIM